MRLFEFQDLGTLRTQLELRRDMAYTAHPQQSATVRLPELSQMMKNMGLAVPKNYNGMVALKNAIDSQGELIDKIESDGTLRLKVDKNVPEPEDDEQDGDTTVDQMASSASKYKPYGS